MTGEFYQFKPDKPWFIVGTDEYLAKPVVRVINNPIFAHYFNNNNERRNSKILQ